MTKTDSPLSVIILHTIVIVLAYSSPFWLDWRLVAFGVTLNYLQIFLAGGCVLSLAQFEDKGMTFHEWYLGKVGIRVNRPKFNFVLRYIMPVVILAVAGLFQLIGHHQVPIRL